MQPSDWYRMGMVPPSPNPNWDFDLQMPKVDLSPDFPNTESEAEAQRQLEENPPNHLVYLRWLYLAGKMTP